MTHHYLFTYKMLVKMALAEPAEFQRRVQENGFLQDLWIHAGQHVAQSRDGVAAITDAPGLSLWKGPHQGGEILVVRLPFPEEPPEAYFLAFLCLEGRMRVFSLEMGHDFERDQMGTYLCEWTNEGHQNFGIGPDPERSAFVTALADFSA